MNVWWPARIQPVRRLSYHHTMRAPQVVTQGVGAER